MKKQVEERFGQILESNEEIKRIEKPHAVRFFVVQFCIAFFAMLIISTCAMIELVDYYGFGVVWAPSAISAFCILIYMLLSIFYYKNKFYCITNKRVIIRSGVVGADYKSIDLRDVSGVKLKKIWFDVLFKKRCGTIILGSLEDKDIEVSFDEMGSLYRLSGICEAEEVEELLKSLIKEVMPKDKTNSSEWKMIKKEIDNDEVSKEDLSKNNDVIEKKEETIENVDSKKAKKAKNK